MLHESQKRSFRRMPDNPCPYSYRILCLLRLRCDMPDRSNVRDHSVLPPLSSDAHRNSGSIRRLVQPDVRGGYGSADRSVVFGQVICPAVAVNVYSGMPARTRIYPDKSGHYRDRCTYKVLRHIPNTYLPDEVPERSVSSRYC